MTIQQQALFMVVTLSGAGYVMGLVSAWVMW